MAETVKLTFGAGRSVKIETRGFKGAACQEATREVEEALGVVKDEKKTAEYYERPVAKQSIGR